ncbi:TonB-dependent receptor [Sulfuricurvum sp.]|uniref:TonB-dependent receptor plug domain-containing protein n=1 Tax=Sulfuricurvum sp. TaxID=2025608 RepID=UPI00260A8380|nr:TonB-dependent receptor [Sulfuricurvum sp.]MDD3598035.1 TonB-dependent receptor [Sulfuricurvum sp.]
MLRHTFSFVACATLAASLEAGTLQLDPISITSNALQSDELHAAYAAEIYTAKDIENTHARNIYDFFNQATSLTASAGYGNPFAQQLDLHGYGLGDSGYENIVVTLNGRRLNNVDMVPQLLGSIPLDSIEKIEVLKGAGSVVYGDGANAGVINIVTKAGSRSELSFYGGNYHTLGEALYLSSSKDKYAYTLHVDHSATGGARTVDGSGKKDAQKSTSGGLELSYHPTDALEIHSEAQFSKSDSIYGSSLSLSEFNSDPSQAGIYGYGSHQTFHNEILRIGSIYDLSDAWELSFDASHEDKRSEYVDYNSVTDYHYDQLNAKARYNTDLFSGVMGLDYLRGKREGYRVSTKDSAALFASGEYRIGAQRVSLGARTEKIDYRFNEIGGEISQNNRLYALEAGYNVILDSAHSLFAHFSHAYQAPDLDRFYTFDLLTYANPFDSLINPAKSNTYTVGYNALYKDSKFKVSLYYIDLKDEIYAYNDGLTIKNTNIDDSHKYGLDLDYSRILTEQWNVGLNYNYVQAIIDHEGPYSGNKLPGVSNHNIKANLSYLPNAYTTLALTQLYRSRAYAQEDFGNSFAQKQRPYRSTDLSMSYARDNYEIFAKITNIFDQANGIWVHDDAIYPVDFTTTFSAGLKFIF